MNRWNVILIECCDEAWLTFQRISAITLLRSWVNSANTGGGHRRSRREVRRKREHRTLRRRCCKLRIRLFLSWGVSQKKNMVKAATLVIVAFLLFQWDVRFTTERQLSPRLTVQPSGGGRCSRKERIFASTSPFYKPSKWEDIEAHLKYRPHLRHKFTVWRS